MTIVPDGWEGILDEGERVLWQGRPDSGFHLAPQHIVMGLFGALFAGFALFWMIMASLGGGYFWMFGLIHFGVGLGIMLGGPVGGPWLRRRTWYTLTDRRAFIATDLPLVGKRLKSYPIMPETPISFDDGELATIHFATRQVRTKNGFRSDKIGFERIPEGRRVLSLMRQVQNHSLPDAQPEAAPIHAVASATDPAQDAPTSQDAP